MHLCFGACPALSKYKAGEGNTQLRSAPIDCDTFEEIEKKEDCAQIENVMSYETLEPI